MEMNAELILSLSAAPLVAAVVHLTFRRVPRRGLFVFNLVKATFARRTPSPYRPAGNRFTEFCEEGRVAKAGGTGQWFPAAATRQAEVACSKVCD
jgi:hypothetical protein